MSMRGERTGSALRRYRSAISTSPSQESERATIRGTTVRARGGTALVVLRPPVLAGLGVSVWDSEVEGSGETFRILRGRRGIFVAGDVVGRGTLFSSESTVAPSGTAVEEGAGRG